ILGYGCFYVLYFAIWSFIVYSSNNPYNAYGYGLAGTLEGGIIKFFSFLLVEGLIVLISSILILIDNRESGLGIDRPWQNTDYTRIILLGITIFFGLPWLFAIHGIFISNIPGLNLIFLGAQPGVGGTNIFDFIYPSVHLGSHHGLGGLLYIVFATLYSILVFRMKNPNIKNFSIFALGVLAAYGVIGYLEDFFHEQVIKRGITPSIWHIIKFLYDYSIYFSLVIGFLIFMIYYFFYRKN
ncbi:MAG: hypothetical protein ACTSO9_20070, partial [Candidatus Helarchaeota archaeon]